MNADGQTANRRRMAMLIWLVMLLSGPAIFLVIYLLLEGKHFLELTTLHALGFLLIGAVSALVSRPALRHFQQVAAQPRHGDDCEYWKHVSAAMFAGHAAADLPFFIGMAAFLIGGFTGTALLLLLLSVVLNSRYRPPLH